MKQLLFLIGLSMPAYVFAQKTIAHNDIIVLQAVYDDLYIAGGTVSINAPVYGDLVVGGGDISLQDSVSGDVIIGGGKVTINGVVGDDLRGIGGEIYLNGRVGGDLVVSAGSVRTGSKSLVRGNTLLGVGDAIIEGVQEGNFKCGGGTIKFNGEVKKNFDCKGGLLFMNGIIQGESILVANNIEIGNQAAFYNDISFWQENNSLDFKGAIKRGSAYYDPKLKINDDDWRYLGFASILFALWYIAAAFLLIILIQYLLGKTISRTVNELSTYPLRSIANGFLFLMAIPALAITLIITLVGIPIGILLIIAYFILLVFASVISSVVIVNWFNQRRKNNWGTIMLSFIGLILFILLKIVSTIPVLGWAVTLVLCCLSFGGIISTLYQQRRESSTLNKKVVQTNGG